MILVFDLDDTLYDEITYVESGFRAVANFAEDRWQLDRHRMYEELQSVMISAGRGQVFDAVLAHNNCYSKNNVKRCLGVYRRHFPSIAIHDAGNRCLSRFQAGPMYLVTDGNKLVQYNKVCALGVQSRFKRILITHRFGVDKAKPSPYCFELIAEAEGVSAEGVFYIGDNPEKDFVGIKPLGYKTIRVLTGMHKHMRKSKHHEAHIAISTLDELTPALLQSL